MWWAVLILQVGWKRNRATFSWRSNMAEPQGRRATAQSIVSSCSATDCTFNENRECHAGEIRVEMGSQGAVCGTYNPRKPKMRP